MIRFLFKYDFSTQVGIESWKHNLNTGWDVTLFPDYLNRSKELTIYVNLSNLCVKLCSMIDGHLL